ncbi:MAG: MATE family efflux transporter [Ignavibacteriales bacterium]|nr:MATE family efflux transporter [Ignavibacteriales bacterium]
MNFIIKKISYVINIFRLALAGNDTNILQGNINRAIILLAIPMTLEMIMESMFAIVDIFFVSKIGVNAIAVVGLTESMLTITYSLGWGLAMGTTAMIARRVGENDNDGASVAAVQSIYLALIISIPIMFTGIFFSVDLLRLMGASADVIAQGSAYTKLSLTFNLIVILLFLINGIFRGAGDAALAMRSLWVANTLNIILDPLFIFGIAFFPELGVKGAAVATIIGRSTGILYQLYHLKKGKGLIKVHKDNWQFKPEVILKLVKLSAGVTAQFIIGSASWIFLMRIISAFGSTALAGYTIAIRIVIFTLMPAWGFSNAAATMVGQNLGANQPERAEKAVWRTGFFNMIFMGTVMIIFFLFGNNISSFFTNEKEVIDNASKCLNIFAIGYLFYAFGMVLVQSFNGAGDTKTPTIMNLFIYWVLQIPLAYTLAIHLGFGAEGAYYSIVISESVFSIVGYFLFKKGKWKTIKV